MLRAFSTLEGIGKTLNPDYRFSEVAQPYAAELLQLQVGSVWGLCVGGGGGVVRGGYIVGLHAWLFKK